MSMIGNYRRISESQLRELLANPEEISSFLYPEEETSAHDHLDIEKAWQVIHFLLNADPWEGDWPLGAAVLGGTEISEEDVGYGPARYLTPAQTKEVAAALGAVSAKELLSRFDAKKLEQAEIYPQGWTGRAEDRQYISGHYVELQKFFAEAAASNQAIVLYLS